MAYESDELRQRIEELEQEVAGLKRTTVVRGVRRRSEKLVLGLPLVDVAIGPDPDTGEVRGHARGIVAIGDIATGFLALGGIARGLVAVGGVSVGGLALGGCSFGLLLAFGGVAVGSIALGGAAVGAVAIGGGALGYYAVGGGAMGEYVITAERQDPEAIRFFSQYLPWLGKWLASG